MRNSVPERLSKEWNNCSSKRQRSQFTWRKRTEASAIKAHSFRVILDQRLKFSLTNFSKTFPITLQHAFKWKSISDFVTHALSTFDTNSKHSEWFRFAREKLKHVSSEHHKYLRRWILHAEMGFPLIICKLCYASFSIWFSQIFTDFHEL